MALKEKGIYPQVAAILVGDDPASRVYVKLKQQSAERMGIIFRTIHHDELTKAELIQLIKQLNKEEGLHGIMVQLPLPGSLDNKDTTNEILKNISPKKDVDGETGKSNFISATGKAIFYCVKGAQDHGYLDDLAKATICVVGATGAVGTAVVKRLKKEGAKKIIECNSKTKDLAAETLKADLIISATGVPGLIKKDMVRPKVAIIDVGSPKAEVEMEAKEIASFITPVPGGIGPMTVVCLMENTVEAASKG